MSELNAWDRRLIDKHLVFYQALDAGTVAPSPCFWMSVWAPRYTSISLVIAWLYIIAWKLCSTMKTRDVKELQAVG